jgi:uncharacterized membrane protein YphA (DoxX/SURF4 family)
MRTGRANFCGCTTALEHLVIVGGFLFVVIHGAGPLSVDILLR